MSAAVPLHRPAVLSPGAHLRVDRGAYWHHAIYLGSGMVIHYSGLTKDKATASVRKESFEAFRKGDPWEIVEYSRAFTPRQVIARALGRLGENNYRFFGNNCEHFARWCKTGHQTSEQVAKAAAGTVGVSAGMALVAGSTGGVIAAGEAAGLAGGASMMRGLAKVGGAVGGGVAAGLAVMTAAPVAASILMVRKIYADDEVLSMAERQARETARNAALVAAAAGVVGSLAAVSAVGVSGLSGAGITSGLAGIGKIAGGRMLTGLVVAVGLPAILVGLTAYIAYRIRKGGRSTQFAVGQLRLLDSMRYPR
jgi:hypothetical protein